jgi:hypothetical protein
MLTARPPWTGANHVQLLERIERTELKWPERDRVSGPCSDLITRLLKRNPSERLSFEDFLQHPFVAGFDLDRSSTSLTKTASMPALTIASTTGPSSSSTQSTTTSGAPGSPAIGPIPRAMVPLVDPSTTPIPKTTTTIPPITQSAPPAVSTPHSLSSYPTNMDAAGPLAAHPTSTVRARTASVSSRPMMPVAAIAAVAAGTGSPSLGPMHAPPSAFAPGSPGLLPTLASAAMPPPLTPHIPTLTPISAAAAMGGSPIAIGQSSPSPDDELDMAILHIFDTQFPPTQEWVVSADDARYFVGQLRKNGISSTRLVEAFDVWPSRLNEWLHKDMHAAIGTHIIERLNAPKLRRQQQAASARRRNSIPPSYPPPPPPSTITPSAMVPPRILVGPPGNNGVMSKKSPSMSPISSGKTAHGSGELPMDYVLVEENGDNSPAISKAFPRGSSSSPMLNVADLYDGSVVTTGGSGEHKTIPATTTVGTPPQRAMTNLNYQHASGLTPLKPSDLGSPQNTPDQHRPSSRPGSAPAHHHTPTPPATTTTAAPVLFSSEEEALEAFYAMWKRALMVAKGAEMKEQLASSSSASLSHVDFSSSAAAASSTSAATTNSSSSAATNTSQQHQQQYGPLAISLVLYVKALSMYHFAIASIADYRRSQAAAAMASAGSGPTASPVAARIETCMSSSFTVSLACVRILF